MVERIIDATAMFEMSTFDTHTRAKMHSPLVNGAVNDTLLQAVPDINQTFLQFIDVMNIRLVDTLLNNDTDFVVHRVETEDVR